jgi:hypothetical protein
MLGMLELFLHFSIRLHGTILNLLSIETTLLLIFYPCSLYNATVSNWKYELLAKDYMVLNNHVDMLAEESSHM